MAIQGRIRLPGRMFNKYYNQPVKIRPLTEGGLLHLFLLVTIGVASAFVIAGIFIIVCSWLVSDSNPETAYQQGQIEVEDSAKLKAETAAEVKKR